MGLFDFIFGKRSEEWYRNQLEKLLSEYNNLLYASSYRKITRTQEGRLEITQEIIQKN